MEDYTILKVIGDGSFGRALLVEQKSSCEQYVMKEIRLPKSPTGIQNSRREAVLLSKMKHPNIVAFRDSFEAGGHLYIVMEYCAGGDLLHRIKQQKNTPFPPEMILSWFAQMCVGTKHVHDQRVLHRDLKSKNIFLTSDGAVKLGDFGSSCVLNSAKAYACTYVGTPYYVSPEIWDNKPYNNKSDVWSLGCVLYELCALCHPFQASSWKSLILKVCRGAYTPLPAHLPYELHYLVKQMFKTNPRDRPSLNTILTSHRISRLLHKHLPHHELKEGMKEGRTSRWKRDEGEKVAAFLGQKSILLSSSVGESFSETPDPMGKDESERPRRRWAKEPSETVLEVLGNAELTSTSSCASSSREHRSSPEFTSRNLISEESEISHRRQWDKSPPERLLSLLENAPVSMAFKTFTVLRPDGDNPLVGPLSPARRDDTDGLVGDAVDDSRLEPRSDDEDTDFEEESPCDWVGELERMVTARE
ncbi:serine/threonine-protein kinase Nek3 [Brienomyrus brachyistius]|uniref:serine/threonine-protein kinase Nek3 n=1 Tax=Brienomyrus brachyistius TaxID=42636 RepID=UPI0020B29DB7|nr:serine/threonine-protein kinase Nek3 [Brienomyrus brachyistius]